MSNDKWAATFGPDDRSYPDAVRSLTQAVRAAAKAERERDEARATLDRVRAIHRSHVNDVGPDDCAECSASAQEWVVWPCKVWISLDGPPDAEECDHHDEWADRCNRCRHPEHGPAPTDPDERAGDGS